MQVRGRRRSPRSVELSIETRCPRTPASPPTSSFPAELRHSPCPRAVRDRRVGERPADYRCTPSVGKQIRADRSGFEVKHRGWKRGNGGGEGLEG